MNPKISANFHQIRAFVILILLLGLLVVSCGKNTSQSTPTSTQILPTPTVSCALPSLNLTEFVPFTHQISNLNSPTEAIQTILPEAQVTIPTNQDARYTAIVVGDQINQGGSTEHLAILEAKTSEDASSIFTDLYNIYRSQGLEPTYLETSIMSLESSTSRIFLVQQEKLVFTLILELPFACK